MNTNLDQKELQMCFTLKHQTGKSFKELVNEYKADLDWYFGEGNKLKVDVQTPQKQPVSKPDTLEVTGVYYGREIVTEGTKQDGSKWILYKVKIKIDAVDKPLNFSTFNGTKGFHDMNEGDEVIVKYKEEQKTNSKGQEYKSKTAIEFINTVSDDLE